MGIRDVIGRITGRTERDPSDVGDGYRLDGGDGRLPELADFVRVGVERFEKAPDADVLAAIGSPLQRERAEPLPAGGRDRRNTIREMVVDSFRQQPHDLPAGSRAPDHDPGFMTVMTRVMADPARLAQFEIEPVDGRNLADANRKVMSYIVAGVHENAMDVPHAASVLDRRSRDLAAQSDDVIYERLRFAPRVRLDGVMGKTGDERIEYVSDLLDAQGRTLRAGGTSPERAIDMALSSRSYDERVASSAPVSTRFEGQQVLTEQTVRLRGLALSADTDEAVRDRFAAIPGMKDLQLPERCSAGFRTMALETIVNIDFERHRLGMVANVAPGFDKAAEHQATQDAVVRIAQNPRGPAALMAMQQSMAQVSR